MQVLSVCGPKQMQPNFPGSQMQLVMNVDLTLTFIFRAYVVPAQKLDTQQRSTFAQQVNEWIKDKVARHKYLRGGRSYSCPFLIFRN